MLHGLSRIGESEKEEAYFESFIFTAAKNWSTGLPLCFVLINFLFSRSRLVGPAVFFTWLAGWLWSRRNEPPPTLQPTKSNLPHLDLLTGISGIGK